MEDVSAACPPDKPKRPSSSAWEWIPAAVCAAAYIASAAGWPEADGQRLLLHLALGLTPGSLCRLFGRNQWAVHRGGVACALVAFLLAKPSLRPGMEDLEKLSSHGLLVAVGTACSFAQPVLGSLRWRMLLANDGIVLSFRRSLALCLGGSFFNIFLPGSTGGDAYRVYAIAAGDRTKLASAVASITLDRFSGLPGLIAILFLAIFLDRDFFLASERLSSILPFLAGTAAVCVLLILYFTFGRRVFPVRSDEAGGFSGTLHKMHRLLLTYAGRRGTLPLVISLSALSHIAAIAACLCFGVAAGAEGIAPVRYFLIIPLAMAVNAIPGAPGGLGQGELAMAALMELAHPGAGNAQAGVLTMLLFRLSNIAAGLCGGAVYALGKSGTAIRDGGGKADEADAPRCR